MSADLLIAMVAAARRSADERARQSASAVERAAVGRRPRGHLFRRTLREPGVRVIAECKRRSPSRGVLRAEYDPAAIAKSYEANGAAAISVLTEPSFFDGSLTDLASVRNVVDLPLLRKDFLVTEFQLIEARAAGADAVLLIVGALDAAALRQLLSAAVTHELAALVEVHDAAELARALDAGATIVGVNCRDLRTLAVKPDVFGELAAVLPSDVVAVAESGLKTAADLARWHAAGYDAFLIGERFMVEAHPGQALAALRCEAAAMFVERHA